MNWEDEGFVIGKRRFRENAIILDVFTCKFGKTSGIVYGGTSRKVRAKLSPFLPTPTRETKSLYFQIKTVLVGRQVVADEEILLMISGRF